MTSLPTEIPILTDVRALPAEEFDRLRAIFEDENKQRKKSFGKPANETLDNFEAALERFQSFFSTPLTYSWLELTPKDWRCSSSFKKAAQIYAFSEIVTAYDFYKLVVGEIHLNGKMVRKQRQQEALKCYLKTLPWSDVAATPTNPISFLEKHVPPELLKHTVAVRQELKDALHQTETNLKSTIFGTASALCVLITVLGFLLMLMRSNEFHYVGPMRK